MSASLSLHPSVYLYIQACVLSPGFDFRLNRRPVRRVEASSPAEAPGRGEGMCGQVSSQGGYSVLGSGVARGGPGQKRADGWAQWLMIVFPLRQRDIDHSRVTERSSAKVNYVVLNTVFTDFFAALNLVTLQCTFNVTPVWNVMIQHTQQFYYNMRFGFVVKKFREGLFKNRIFLNEEKKWQLTSSTVYRKTSSKNENLSIKYQWSYFVPFLLMNNFWKWWFVF